MFSPSRCLSVRPPLATFACFLFLLSVSLIARTSECQDATATLVGTVTEKGASIPNAAVTATNVATGQVRTTVTGEDGRFTFPGLSLGRYTVKVTVAGFRSMSQDTSLQAGAAATLNFDLDILPVGSTLFGQIKGTVRDDKSKSIHEATIEFLLDDGSDAVNEKSSSDGTYSRSGLRPGTYNLVVKADGYLPGKKRVKLGAHEQKTADFKLKPAS